MLDSRSTSAASDRYDEKISGYNVSAAEYREDEEPKTSQMWGDAFKSMLLARKPMVGAPLEFGGHREVADTKGNGLMFSFSRCVFFFGPGVLLTVPFIDPDNFQSSVQDGQNFGYKMLFMVWFSLAIAIFLQVSLHCQLSLRPCQPC